MFTTGKFQVQPQLRGKWLSLLKNTNVYVFFTKRSDAILMYMYFYFLFSFFHRIPSIAQSTTRHLSWSPLERIRCPFLESRGSHRWRSNPIINLWLEHHPKRQRRSQLSHPSCRRLRCNRLENSLDESQRYRPGRHSLPWRWSSRPGLQGSGHSLARRRSFPQPTGKEFFRRTGPRAGRIAQTRMHEENDSFRKRNWASLVGRMDRNRKADRRMENLSSLFRKEHRPSSCAIPQFSAMNRNGSDSNEATEMAHSNLMSEYHTFLETSACISFLQKSSSYD